MVKVGILMGSDSDLPIMQKAAQMLEKFGIEYEMTIISAHRMCLSIMRQRQKSVVSK